MTPKIRYNFWIDDELAEALKVIKDRDGISESEQIRRAVRDWAHKKGVKVRAERKRTVTRKRS